MDSVVIELSDIGADMAEPDFERKFSVWSSVERVALERATFLDVNCDTTSGQAIALRGCLIAKCVSFSGRKATCKFDEAIGALLAGLMKVARVGVAEYAYRPMSADSFSECRIGYEVFKRATDSLEGLGYLELVRGYGGGGQPGRVTRLRATPSLLALADEFGIRPSDWDVHFNALPRPATIPRPLKLKSSSVSKKGKKVPGVDLAFDRAGEKSAALIAQVQALNSYFCKVDIQPSSAHYAFHRIFSQGDLSEFDWNKGGRLYSIGAGYQQMKSEERASICLNGEPVVEIDIKSSHLTILHGVNGIPCDEDERFYHVHGLPRGVVKTWITMTLGNDKFQTRWSEKAKRRYAKSKLEELGKAHRSDEEKEAYIAMHMGDLQKEHPIKDVRARVISHIPLLKDWPTSPIRWGDLQYIESCAIIDTVYGLAMNHDIPALPVHDSIIVPISKQAVACHELEKRFEIVVGVKPVLEVKGRHRR